MAGYAAPGIRYKLKCPYCGEIKESGGIKMHIRHKHAGEYKKSKYAALLDGNFYKSEYVIFPQKESKAMPARALSGNNPPKVITPNAGPAGEQAGAEVVAKPLMQQAEPLAVSQAAAGNRKPKHLEILEVKPKVVIRQEAQPVQKEDEFGCQRCGATWQGFKPKCPKCSAELEYSEE